VIYSEVLLEFFFLIRALTTLSLVDLGNYWITNGLDLLKFLLKIVLLGIRVGVEPVGSISDGVGDGALVVGFELVGKLFLIFDTVLHLVDVVLKGVLGVDLLLDGLIFLSILLRVLDHFLDLLLGESTLIVGDGDGLFGSGSLILGAHSHDGVLIDFESDLNLWDTLWCWWDSVHVEFTKVVVVLGKSSLTLENVDGDGSLLILVGSENLGFLGWDDSSSWDDLGHDSSDGLNTKGKWGNINEEDILGLFRLLTTEDTTLNGGTVSDSLVWVDTSVWLFTIEVVLDELLNLWDSSGSTDKYDLIDLALLHTGVIEDLGNWLECFFEKISAKFFESSSSDGFTEINSVHKTINSDLNLMDTGEISLGLLDLVLQLLESSSITLNVFLVLLLEDLDEMLGNSLIEIFSSKMGITSSGNDLENSVIDGEEGNIESTSTKIEDNDVLLS